MPFITSKKTAISMAAFVWDAFPPPPPEAETWQLDPDNIARPGGLPDPRSHRDPEHGRRSKSSSKEAKMLTIPQLNGQAQSGNTLGRGLGEWPALPPRGTSYLQVSMQDTRPTSPPLKSSAALETSYKQSAATDKSFASVTGPSKGTMELMPAPNHRRPEAALTSRASTKSVSSSKSLPPAWAASLEKAIAEDDRKLDALAATTTTTESKLVSRPETIQKKSIPPHLRSKIGDEGTAPPQVGSSQSLSMGLNPNAKVYEALVEHADSIKDEALAWEMASLDHSIEHAKHVSISNAMLPISTNISWDLRIQQDILDRCITKPPTTTTIFVTVPTARAPPDHDVKVKIMLIRAMEHELDLHTVAPERQLMAMQHAELDRYYKKVYLAHQQWWEAIGKA